jgi:hypothetical protein
MLKRRQRDLSAVQDCAAAFSFLTWRKELHPALVEHKTLPTLLEMMKLDCANVRSSVAVALCNLAYTPSIVDELVSMDVVSVLIQVGVCACGQFCIVAGVVVDSE